jgi:hypothetical protein
VYIDNVATTSFERTYSSNDDARAETHLIELRHGDQTVLSRTVDLNFSSCLAQVAPADSVSISYCLYESGDLRFQSATVRGPRPCVGDGFCDACSPLGCANLGKRCTSFITSTSPVASHLSCGPIGPRQLGETCSFIDDVDGAYDDCGVGLLCVGGACRQTCLEGKSKCGPACDYLPGHAPEILVCM